MITVRKAGLHELGMYDSIPMQVWISSVLELERIEGLQGGIRLVETAVKPRLKDFKDAGADPLSWQSQWDLSSWAFFLAFQGDVPVGGAAVASGNNAMRMLSGRRDAGVLWDIRVHSDHKGRGIGRMLFEKARSWAEAQGLAMLRIECQNNNVPAVKFYHSQGARLISVNEHAYDKDSKFRHEVQLLFSVDL